MRPAVFKKVLALGFVSLLLVGIMLAPAVKAVTDKDDTVSAEPGTLKTERAERVRIRIDRRGISVEKEGRGKETNVVIEAPVSRVKKSTSDIVRFGKSIHIEADEEVKGDVVCVGGSVSVEGRVIGDVVVIGGSLRARSGSEINGDAVVIGGRLHVDPDATIQGDKVTIGGAFPLLGFPSFIGPHGYLPNLLTWPIKLVFGLLFSFLVVLIMLKRVERSRTYLKKEYFKSFGLGLLIGFIGMFSVPMIMILLAITLIGIPIAILVGFGVVAVLIIAWAIFAYDLGIRIKEKFDFGVTSPYGLVSLGVLVLFLPKLVGYVLSVIPFMWPLGLSIRVLGSLLFLFALSCGLGALFSSKFGKREASFVSTPPPGLPTESPTPPSGETGTPPSGPEAPPSPPEVPPASDTR